jgi:3-methyladenine DNA glycosylase Tag
LKLGNMSFLDTAREHLNSAQFALELAHGKDLSRLMQVRGDEFVVQKTLYVRLAVLRGVVAWHRGHCVCFVCDVAEN